MSAVYLDGESVSFEGNAPSGLTALLQLIDQHCAQQERVLTSVLADKTELLDLNPEHYPLGYKELVITSTPLVELLAQMIQNQLSESDETLSTFNRFSQICLSQSWQNTATELSTIPEKILPLCQLCENLLRYQPPQAAPWQALLKAQLAQISAITDDFTNAAEATDIAALSDACGLDLLSITEVLLATLREEVLPHLKSNQAA